MNKQELIKAAKEHGFYITENSNAIHAAKNLRDANDRLVTLESIMDITNKNEREVKLRDYKEKHNI